MHAVANKNRARNCYRRNYSSTFKKRTLISGFFFSWVLCCLVFYYRILQLLRNLFSKKLRSNLDVISMNENLRVFFISVHDSFVGFSRHNCRSRAVVLLSYATVMCSVKFTLRRGVQLLRMTCLFSSVYGLRRGYFRLYKIHTSYLTGEAVALSSRFPMSVANCTDFAFF